MVVPPSHGAGPHTTEEELNDSFMLFDPTVNELEIKERRQTVLLPPLLFFSRFSPLFLLSFNYVLPLSRLPSTVVDTFKLKRQPTASLLN